MATVLIVHEVDDVEHWVQSPKRSEVFGPMGVTVQTFVNSAGANRVGLIADIPDMDAFNAMLESPVGVAAMQFDGVRPETIQIYVRSA